MDINSIKLPDSATTQSEGQAPAATPTPAATPQAVAGTAAPVETPKSTPPTPAEGQDWEWDGNPNNVPPQFQKYVKSVQRHFTKRGMADAELRQLGQKHQEFTTSDEYKAFQAWKQSQAGGPQTVSAPAQEDETLINPAEWEEAQLDGTGRKFQAIVDKIANARVNAAVQQYQSGFQQLQQQAQVVAWQNALSDFADIHPDILDLHEKGVFRPLLESVLKSGTTKSYEDAIQAAYKQAVDIREGLRADATASAQQRVVEKTGAVTLPGVSTGVQNEFVAETKQDAFEQAFKFAAEGKKVKVRSKR